MFRRPIKKGVEIYAEATYLKYRSARDDFGATVGSIPELETRMAAAESESLLLLEGERTDTGELVGALLLRVAWSGDLVVDFVGTNFAATKLGTPRLENTGLMLVYTALLVGRQINAPLIYAETARHSAAWWGKFLLAGDNLIKVDDVEATWRRLHEFLEKDGKMTIVSSA